MRTVQDTAPLPPPGKMVWPVEEVTAHRSLLASRRLLVLLVGLCLVLAAAAGVTAYRSQQRVTDGSSAGAITSVEARASALPAAAALTEQVLSYDWRTLDADVAASRAVLAPGLRGEFTEAMSKVKDQTLENKVQLTADVVATSIISASEERVEALVFVNQTTRSEGAGTPRVDQNRVRVTLTPAGADWRVSRLDSF